MELARRTGVPDEVAEKEDEPDKYILLRFSAPVRAVVDAFHQTNLDVARDIYAALDVVLTTPKRSANSPRDIKHLEGPYGKLRDNLRCHYRFRLAHYHRMVYKVNDERREVDIIYIGPHP